jgi:hypothetical protein
MRGVFCFFGSTSGKDQQDIEVEPWIFPQAFIFVE